MTKLLGHYQSVNLRTLSHLPNLSCHYQDIEEGKFQGCELVDGYLVVDEKGEGIYYKSVYFIRLFNIKFICLIN